MGGSARKRQRAQVIVRLSMTLVFLETMDTIVMLAVAVEIIGAGILFFRALR